LLDASGMRYDAQAQIERPLPRRWREQSALFSQCV
jgi:hypothetical protein